MLLDCLGAQRSRLSRARVGEQSSTRCVRSRPPRRSTRSIRHCRRSRRSLDLVICSRRCTRRRSSRRRHRRSLHSGCRRASRAIAPADQTRKAESPLSLSLEWECRRRAVRCVRCPPAGCHPTTRGPPLHKLLTGSRLRRSSQCQGPRLLPLQPQLQPRRTARPAAQQSSARLLHRPT